MAIAVAASPSSAGRPLKLLLFGARLVADPVQAPLDLIQVLCDELGVLRLLTGQPLQQLLGLLLPGALQGRRLVVVTRPVLLLEGIFQDADRLILKVLVLPLRRLGSHAAPPLQHARSLGTAMMAMQARH